MAYEMTKRYIGMVLILMVALAIMAMLVLALGRKSRSNAITAPAAERIKRSPPSEPSIVVNDDDDDDNTLYDVEDFIGDYKITRLTKPNSEYYSLAYNDDDADDVVSARSV